MTTTRITSSWQSFAVQFRQKGTRLAALESQIEAAARDIASGRQLVQLFGKSRRTNTLNLRTINQILRVEGSIFRLFKTGHNVLFAQIAKEELTPAYDAYFFSETELFTNLPGTFAAMALPDGLIAVRQKSMVAELGTRLFMLELLRVRHPASHLLQIIRTSLALSGIRSSIDIPAQKGQFIEEIQELELIHERGHLERGELPAFRLKMSHPMVHAIDEVLSDIDVFEHIIQAKNADQTEKLMLTLLVESLNCYAGALASNDPVSILRYSFRSAILLQYFDSLDYQRSFPGEIKIIKAALLALAKQAAESNNPTFDTELLRLAPAIRVNAVSHRIDGGNILSTIEPTSLPSLIPTAKPTPPPEPPKQLIPLRDNLIAEQALASIEHQKAECDAQTFFELVPGEYRDRIIRMVEEAYPSKGQLMTREEFQENMARCWLANQAAFEIVAQAQGFCFIARGRSIPADINSAILILTISGSIIGLSMPKLNDLTRTLLYERIKLRQEAEISPQGSTRLTRSINIGERVKFPGNFTSSMVIGLSTHPSAEVVAIQGTLISMTRTFNTINQTVWRIKKPGEEKKDD